MRRSRITPGLLLFAAISGAQDDPDYPLGKLGVPPFARPAEPLRLFDLAFSVLDEGSRVSRFETRLKLGGWAFFGGEVRGDRLGVFFDTQRLALGVSEENGAVDLEGGYRGSFFLASFDAEKRQDATWDLSFDGSLRLSPDFELLAGYTHDTDDARGGPPSLEAFVETGRLPRTGRPTRVLRSGSAGFLYQRDNHLEVGFEASVARLRAEAGFDQTRSRARASGTLNVSVAEIDGVLVVDRLRGRLARTEALAELGAAVRFAPHFVATARTRQAWQPDVERFLREVCGGVTFYGRRFRFARSSDAAEELLRLTRRANALGYNERRIYDASGLRALRDRLSLSKARSELTEALEALYRAEVRERNVPQLGFELERRTDELLGSRGWGYRVFFGIPFHWAWPFTTGEDRVELLKLDWRWRDEAFPSVGWQTRSHAVTATAELSRQHVLRFRWERPGQTPEELAFGIGSEPHWSAEYIYALGR